MGKTIELYGFPITVEAADVRKFVENFTGEGTIQTLKVRHGKSRVPRAFAIIQFTTEDFAESMMSRANYDLLRYGTAYLKARVMERDIEKISENVPSLEGVKLYFGCQISKERFAVLERMQNVSLTFGSGNGKVVLKFSRNFVQGVCELLWIKNVLSDLGFKSNETMNLYCDNTSAITIPHNHVQHDRTKHVENDRHFIKEKLEAGIISCPFVRSELQLSDVLTK